MKITKSALWAKTVKKHAGDKPIFWVVQGITPVPRRNPGTKFQLKSQFNFLDQICLKRAFPVKN